MDKQELFEQMEELLDEYLLSAELIPVEEEEQVEDELQEGAEAEMQEESDDEILKSIRK